MKRPPSPAKRTKRKSGKSSPVVEMGWTEWAMEEEKGNEIAKATIKTCSMRVCGARMIIFLVRTRSSVRVNEDSGMISVGDWVVAIL